MLNIILVRAHFSQNVRYWYEICDVLVPIFTRCEELVPIFHGVKFAKCEICGLTQHVLLNKLTNIQLPILAFCEVLSEGVQL